MYDEISKFYQKKFDDSRKEIDSLYTSIQTQNNAAREFLELLNDAKPHSK
jgi:DNA-dependent RNA polymerase auxiliary subunit epsilon